MKCAEQVGCDSRETGGKVMGGGSCRLVVKIRLRLFDMQGVCMRYSNVC